MKIKDLIFNRDKLRKYDELKEWKEYFEHGKSMTVVSYEFLGNTVTGHKEARLSNHVKAIIVNALEAEIQKLDEE